MVEYILKRLRHIRENCSDSVEIHQENLPASRPSDQKQPAEKYKIVVDEPFAEYFQADIEPEEKERERQEDGDPDYDLHW